MKTDISDEIRIIAGQYCKKCPEYLCKEYHARILDKQLFYLISNKQFSIFPPCGGINADKKFLIRLYADDFPWIECVTLYEAIDALLYHKNIQLEDALRLTRIKNELE